MKIIAEIVESLARTFTSCACDRICTNDIRRIAIISLRDKLRNYFTVAELIVQILNNIIA